ncbi:MAG: hypothetical protein JSW61_04490 [Candidatus Thorarchaeota archaeon]|nr:MAG: hypothetical protein JSW61_04490 [Candidatus Thorarchaeota archaeon]
MNSSVGFENGLWRLIPKNHFVSMSFFREEPLINWGYTESVLFTAYDVCRSSDFWIDSVIRSGKTLKEAMTDLGFPKKTSMMADTGVFEMEAKKAGIARSLGIDVDIALTNEEIFEAYRLSGADYFVSPDEIIQPTESSEEMNKKIEVIKHNFTDLLDEFPARKIVAVIQGTNRSTITMIFDFYRSHGIRHFAIGGLIPLWRHDKELFKKTLNYVRKITKGNWLHAFGLPILRLLPFYLHKVGVDSIDTSMLLYLSARRRYVVGFEIVPVRLVDFASCECVACSVLSPKLHPRRYDFFMNLYIQNIVEAAKYSENPELARKKKVIAKESQITGRRRQTDHRVESKTPRCHPRLGRLLKRRFRRTQDINMTNQVRVSTQTDANSEPM